MRKRRSIGAKSFVWRDKFSELPRNRYAARAQSEVEQRDDPVLQIGVQIDQTGCGRRSCRAARRVRP